jgi:hypothetical protein
MTADQWRQLLTYVWTIVDSGESNSHRNQRHPDPVKDAEPDTLRRAREEYGQIHQVSVEQASQVDSMIVLGEFYFRQYEMAFDESYKLRGLPYAAMMGLAVKASAKAEQMHRQQRANPFLPTFGMAEVALKVGAVDRQLAALTAVEAIRSYAAANMGNLPARLEDVTETPVPINPLTGKAFEYRVENDVATLADSQGESTLAYTIRIRK